MNLTGLGFFLGGGRLRFGDEKDALRRVAVEGFLHLGV